MKPVSDAIQIGLFLPGPLKLLASVLLVLLVLQALKSLAEALGLLWVCLAWIRARLIKITVFRMVFVALAACVLYGFSNPIKDGLQWLEQVQNPVYVADADTSTHALAVYEAALARKCDSYECEIVKTRVREIAGKVGCSPLAIMEVAYSECGDSKRKSINPFAIRTDGVAAGFIQFTRAGLPGILTDGRQTTLPEVKEACKRRDMGKMMDWTEQYLVSRAKGVPLVDACGVYTCVFAPGYVGSKDGQTLYSTKDGGAYYENAIFDGYYIDHAGRIMRSRKMQDGRITIGELRLHLEAKKAGLLKQTR